MKRAIIWALIGWGLAFLVSPRDVVSWVRPKA